MTLFAETSDTVQIFMGLFSMITAVGVAYLSYLTLKLKQDQAVAAEKAEAMAIEAAVKREEAAKKVEEVRTSLDATTAVTTAKLDAVALKTQEAALTARKSSLDVMEVTVKQNEKLDSVAAQIEVIHKATNSLTDRLMAKTEAEGVARGGVEERARADAATVAARLAAGPIEEKARADAAAIVAVAAVAAATQAEKSITAPKVTEEQIDRIDEIAVKVERIEETTDVIHDVLIPVTEKEKRRHGDDKTRHG